MGSQFKPVSLSESEIIDRARHSPTIRQLKNRDVGILGSFTSLEAYDNKTHIADVYVSHRALPSSVFVIYLDFTEEILSYQKIDVMRSLALLCGQNHRNEVRFRSVEVFDGEAVGLCDALAAIGFPVFCGFSSSIVSRQPTEPKPEKLYFDNTAIRERSKPSLLERLFTHLRPRVSG